MEYLVILKGKKKGFPYHGVHKCIVYATSRARTDYDYMNMIKSDSTKCQEI